MSNTKTEKIPNVTSIFSHENEAIKHDLLEFKVKCLKVICIHGNKSTILLSIFRTTPDVSSKFILKYVESQRKCLFNHKGLIFGFQILDLKDHFSASRVCTERMMDHQYRENGAFKL